VRQIKGGNKMIGHVSKPTCYDTKRFVRKNELLISAKSDFDLTEGKVYLTTRNQGEGTFGDCIWVVNDKGIEQDYSSEYFCHYEGEIVSTD
jgi:hypothetical protein